MSSECRCHTSEWCFYCKMYVPLEKKHEKQAKEIEELKVAYNNSVEYSARVMIDNSRLNGMLELAVEELERVAEVELKDYPELSRFIRKGVLLALEEIQRRGKGGNP